VAVVTAVQEATARSFQTRVMSLLESLAAAMPGLGFVLGGALAAIASPRTSYLVAGSALRGDAGRRAGAVALARVSADRSARRGRSSLGRHRPSDASASPSSSTVA